MGATLNFFFIFDFISLRNCLSYHSYRFVTYKTSFFFFFVLCNIEISRLLKNQVFYLGIVTFHILLNQKLHLVISEGWWLVRETATDVLNNSILNHSTQQSLRELFCFNFAISYLIYISFKSILKAYTSASRVSL